MTQQHLDRKDDARQSLARANELSDESKPPAWNRKLTLKFLRREAEALIGEGTKQKRRPGPALGNL
jgi:hypothetical protein